MGKKQKLRANRKETPRHAGCTRGTLLTLKVPELIQLS
jgi:hypothetical protein